MSPEPTLSDIGEASLIRAISTALGPVAHSPPGALGIGDDAAVIPFAAPRALATVDALIEGVHFTRAADAPADLGWKALAVNLSDIAAMGGTPRAALVTLAAPGDLPLAWVTAFYTGLGELAAQHGVWVAGGDTTGSPGPVLISVTVLGDAGEQVLTRDAAQPGDVVFTTGYPGRSAAGRAMLHDQERSQAHRRPVPQVAAGQALGRLGCRIALLDDSDGLGRSAHLLAAASGVDVVLTPGSWPTDLLLQAIAAECRHDPLDWALQGGEDYHLVGTCASADWQAVQAASGGWPVGYVSAPAATPQARIQLGSASPEALAGEMGHAHFARSSFPPG